MRRILTLIACALSLQPSPAQEPPRLTGIAHVAIRVADLNKSKAFYLSLGYTQPFSIEKDGKVTEAFVKINDRQFLELYPADAEHPVGFQHVCWEAVNLKALAEGYATQGVVAPPVRKAGAGNLLLAWKGPEGQTEEITEYLPGSKHSDNFGRDLGENRVSTRLVGVAIPMGDPKAAAEYFETRMGFQEHGVREGAIVVAPPDVKGASLGLLPADSRTKLALVFGVGSVRTVSHRLKLPERKGRVVVQDPDGNLVVIQKD